MKVPSISAQMTSVSPRMAVTVAATTTSVRPALAHLRLRPKQIARRWVHEVDLELDCQDRRVGRHGGVSGVARGGVGDRRDHAAVEIAVLLGDLLAIRDFDDGPAALGNDQLRADQLHQPLPLEAFEAAVVE